MYGRALLSPERRRHTKERGEQQATKATAGRGLETACNGAETHPIEATSHPPDITTTTRRDPDTVTCAVTRTVADGCPTDEAAPTAAHTNAPASGPTRTADPTGTDGHHNGRSDQRGPDLGYRHQHNATA
jgi:hypothetical protein